MSMCMCAMVPLCYRDGFCSVVIIVLPIIILSIEPLNRDV